MGRKKEVKAMSESEVKKCPKCSGELETLAKEYDYVDNRIVHLCCKNCGYIESYKEMKRKSTNVELRIDERLTQDARNVLLRHYSSKSTNQTAIILTLAIIFFSFVQALPYAEVLPNSLVNPFVVLFLAALSFLAIRALSRLFLWGKMAGTILYVRMLTKKELEEGKHLAGRTLERLILTRHLRLDKGAAEETKKHMHLIGCVLNWLTREPYNHIVFLCIFAIFAIFSAIFSVPQPTICFYVICLLVGMVVILFGVYRYTQKERNKP